MSAGLKEGRRRRLPLTPLTQDRQMHEIGLLFAWKKLNIKKANSEIQFDMNI